LGHDAPPLGNPPGTTKQIAEAVDLPTNTVRRALEDLIAYGLASCYGQGEGKADVWRASDWTRGRMGP
jgi:predicted ArsR family transcriptional regulator